MSYFAQTFAEAKIEELQAKIKLLEIASDNLRLKINRANELIILLEH